MTNISKFLFALLVLAFAIISPNYCKTDKTIDSIVHNPSEIAWSSTLQVYYINPDMSSRGAGSGTYMLINNRPFILTAAHVINAIPRHIIMRACHTPVNKPPGDSGELCNEINRYEGQGAIIDIQLDLALMPLFGFSNATPVSMVTDYDWTIGEPIYVGACPRNALVINPGIITGLETDTHVFTNADAWWGSSGGGVYNGDGLLIGVLIQLQGWAVIPGNTPFGPFQHVVEGNKIFTLIPATFLENTQP